MELNALLLENFHSLLDNVSLRYLHSMFVHFPIAYSYLILAISLRALFKKNTERSNSPIAWKILFLFCLILTNLAGRISAEKMGLNINDANWILQNREISSLVLAHRFWGNIATLYWIIIITIELILIKKALLTSRIKVGIFIASLIGTLIISFNALIGSHIGQ